MDMVYVLRNTKQNKKSLLISLLNYSFNFSISEFVVVVEVGFGFDELVNDDLEK